MKELQGLDMLRLLNFPVAILIHWESMWWAALDPRPVFPHTHLALRLVDVRGTHLLTPLVGARQEGLTWVLSRVSGNQ